MLAGNSGCIKILSYCFVNPERDNGSDPLEQSKKDHVTVWRLDGITPRGPAVLSVPKLCLKQCQLHG